MAASIEQGVLISTSFGDASALPKHVSRRIGGSPAAPRPNYELDDYGDEAADIVGSTFAKFLCLVYLMSRLSQNASRIFSIDFLVCPQCLYQLQEKMNGNFRSLLEPFGYNLPSFHITIIKQGKTNFVLVIP